MKPSSWPFLGISLLFHGLIFAIFLWKAGAVTTVAPGTQNPGGFVLVSVHLDGDGSSPMAAATPVAPVQPVPPPQPPQTPKLIPKPKPVTPVTMTHTSS